MITLAIIAVILLVGVFDVTANWGKAYGNVTINGIAVGGMTADEMRDLLKSEYGPRVSHAQVTIFASEDAMKRAQLEESPAVDPSIAEQISAEDSYKAVESWATDALSLKANVPYDDAVEKALAIGRSDGGLLTRLFLLGGTKDIPLSVNFDEGCLEELASQIDLTIGSPRVDATVVIDEGVASPVEGKGGTMVDRRWFSDKLSHAMIDSDTTESFVAEAVPAESRISFGEASGMADSINRAISEGVIFSYKGKTWLAGPVALGDWTQVAIEGEEGSWHLAASIVPSSAVPIVVEKVGAEITSNDIIVTYEKTGNDIVVHTAGSGNIPEVSLAIEETQKVLYGENGIAWGHGASEAPTIEVTESDRPETLSFDDALNIGVITPIGEYTTEFSNVEGTENRNHNIKLAADIINDSIVEGRGGTWSFNDRAGNTNEEAGFWTAGSIVEGEFVDSVGGGICQVATTVFNAVLEAGIDVAERHNHTLYIASYPDGRDAAVDYPSDLDLVWKNNLESDVVLKMSYTDTSITAKIYSVYTGNKSEYNLSNWEKGEKYTTVFKEDDTLGDGEYYLKTTGEDGKKITMTRTVYDGSGAVVKTDTFASDYDPKDEVYVIGKNVDKEKLKRKDDGSDKNKGKTDNA